VHAVLQAVHNVVQRVVMLRGFVLSVGHGESSPGTDASVVSPPLQVWLLISCGRNR
jgi:hypothetical protein